MPAIILPRKWTQQPQRPVDAVSDLGLTVLHNYASGQLVDSVTRTKVLGSTNHARVVHNGLLCARRISGDPLYGSADGYYLGNITGNTYSSWLNGAKSLSFIVVGQLYNTETTNIPVLASNDGNDATKLEISTSGVVTLSLLNGNYSPKFTATAQLPSNSGCLVATWEQPNRAKFFHNGKQLDATITLDQTVTSVLINRIRIFNATGIYSILYPTALVGVAKTAWMDAGSISANPWKLFKRDPQRLYFDVSTGLPTLTSIAASNITSSGARLTVN